MGRANRRIVSERERKNRQTDRDRETEREQDGVVGNVVEGVYFDGCPAWRESTKLCLKINGEYGEEESRSSLASNYRLKLLASTRRSASGVYMAIETTVRLRGTGRGGYV